MCVNEGNKASFYRCLQSAALVATQDESTERKRKTNIMLLQLFKQVILSLKVLIQIHPESAVKDGLKVTGPPIMRISRCVGGWRLTGVF